MITGPRLLVAAVVLAYAGFWAWYGGHGEPLTPEETEQYLARIAEKAGTDSPDQGHGRERLFAELRLLAESDDGNAFLMLNLIDFRERALYSPGTDYGDDARAADDRYNRVIVPALLKRAGHPIYVGEVQGRFIDETDDVQWERVAIVRYRSRRDLMETVLEVADRNAGQHKWAAIERTHVFPMQTVLSLFLAQGVVAVLLAALGGMIHLLLRRHAWYARRPV